VTSPVRLRPEIAALPPYRQGAQAAPDAFKLSSNENPFDPLPAVVEALRDAVQVNRYPDATAAGLRAVLAERHGVTTDEVHVAAGSVSLLSQFLLAAVGPGDEVVYAWRSFEAYPGLVTVAGGTSVQVPLRPDGSHDLAAMAAAVTDRTRVAVLCSPNNPTGTTISTADFEAFMAAVPDHLLVLLDEAYAEFVTDEHAVRGESLTERHPNLVVLRTFSKAYGLAALRVGFAVGAATLLDAARSTAIALSVTDQAQRAALASLEHEAELLERVDRVVALRDRVRAGLLDQGWAVPEAQGNFVWLPTGERTAAAARTLAEHGLVVRPFAPEGLRITIGEPESVDALLRACRELAPGASR
jgi:histidinol-phosphate aminotransferase